MDRDHGTRRVLGKAAVLGCIPALGLALGFGAPRDGKFAGGPSHAIAASPAQVDARGAGAPGCTEERCELRLRGGGLATAAAHAPTAAAFGSAGAALAAGGVIGVARPGGWQVCSRCGQRMGASLDGEPVYCAGAGGANCGDTAYGHGYQCMELVSRYLRRVKHKRLIVTNAGAQFCDAAARTGEYIVYGPKYTRTRTQRPVVGDILVWNSDHGRGTGYAPKLVGHVAVVTRSDAANLSFVQQHWGQYRNGRWNQVAWSSTPWDGAKWLFGSPVPETDGSHVAACWVHPR